MRWTGHLLRLPQDTPARLALDQIKKPSKKPRGRSKKTWIHIINEDKKIVDCKISLIKKLKSKPEIEIFGDTLFIPVLNSSIQKAGNILRLTVY